jgi:type IV pilus assembly protein PilB
VPFKRNKQEDTRTEDVATSIAAAPVVTTSAATSTVTSMATSAVAVDERDPSNGSFGPHTVASEEKLAGVSRGRLGSLLIERNLVSEQQLELGLEQQREAGGKIGEVLVEMGFLDDLGLVAALSEFLGVPVSNLRRENVEPDALALIPEEVAREQHAVPIRLSDNGLDVAAAEPSEELRDQLVKVAGRPVRMMIAPLSDIRWAIDSNYRAIGGVDNLIAAFVSVEGSRKRVAGDQPDADLISDDAPVVQVVDRILTQAIRDRASDVHIEPGEDGVRIRFRVDGALKEVLTLPDVMGPGLVSRIKIMAGMNIVERRRPQDGQLTTIIDGAAVDVRVATVATIAGESCVMRVLDKSKSLFRLGDLGMPTDTHAMYSKIVRAPFGMMLCAGPTGSGKTTTLYATLSEVSNPTLNVMTIEDPVEYVFPSINQIQTNEQAGITFATGLKSILRQDPDVILVGEIRDVETARVATQSALTGHFVISSMHATDSVSGLHRFLDMGIESFLIASSVLAVVAQRLVRRICPSCKTAYALTNEERMFYEESGGPPEKEIFYHGTGCNFCGGTGFKERIGVYELLHMTPEIKRLIVGWATQEELRNLAKKQGMRTLRQEAISLVAQDITSVDEVVRSMYTL